jgi:DNA-binding beta-propeller fold protein YncE
MPRNAHAQLYVTQSLAENKGIVSEYRDTTARVINARLITGLHNPSALMVRGDSLFVADAGDGIVSVYDTKLGTLSPLLKPLSNPQGLAFLNDSPGNFIIFVSNGGNGTVGEYDGGTGRRITRQFIAGLNRPTGLALWDNLVAVVTSSISQ